MLGAILSMCPVWVIEKKDIFLYFRHSTAVDELKDSPAILPPPRPPSKSALRDKGAAFKPSAKVPFNPALPKFLPTSPKTTGKKDLVFTEESQK